MIEALQQIISQLEQLPEEAQTKIAAELQDRLVVYQRWEAEKVQVSQMSKDEFAAFLEERKVSKPYLAPGYRGIYYSDEEFDEALRSWSGPEAIALYESEPLNDRSTSANYRRDTTTRSRAARSFCRVSAGEAGRIGNRPAHPGSY